MAIIRVYGHPRSGNNLLMALLALNFYPGMNLETRGRIGHWNNRVLNQHNPYGKLAGTHLAFHDVKNKVVRPCIYVYRDGPAVAYSLWRTKHFQPPENASMTLSDFLRWPLDWCGSPGNPKGFAQVIAAHWKWHLQSWAVRATDDILKVRYETLVQDPGQVRREIAQFYKVKPVKGLKLVKKKVGWFPNEGTIDAWRSHFSDADLEYFHQFAPRPFWGYWEG